MNALTQSGILGDIPLGELVKENKGSDMWKDAVSHEVLDTCYMHMYVLSLDRS